MESTINTNSNLEEAKELYKEIENKKVEKLGNNLFLNGLHHKVNKEKKELMYASVYTSPNCQLNCLYCSKHYDIKKVRNGEIKPLTKEEILNFIKDAKKLGLRTLIFQGMAEPTFDENFRDYISYAHEIGIDSIVFSNILKLDDDLAAFLYKNNVSIAPSIDSLRKDVYNYLTGSNKYEELCKAIDVLKKYYGGKDKWIDGNRPRVLVSMVVTNYNVGDLKAMRKLCNEQGWLLCSKAFGVKGAAKDNFPQLACDKEYYSLLQKLAVDFADKVMITETTERKCACGGENGLLVDLDGRIGACGDTLTRVDANIRTNTVEECFNVKQNYVKDLDDYVCLSKALRGYGDIKK